MRRKLLTALTVLAIIFMAYTLSSAKSKNPGRMDYQNTWEFVRSDTYRLDVCTRADGWYLFGACYVKGRHIPINGR